jgi:hypothetical protein
MNEPTGAPLGYLSTCQPSRARSTDLGGNGRVTRRD